MAKRLTGKANMVYSHRVVGKQFNPLAAGVLWEQKASYSCAGCLVTLPCNPPTGNRHSSKVLFHVTVQHESNNSNTTRRAEPLARPCSFALPWRRSGGTRAGRQVGADNGTIGSVPTYIVLQHVKRLCAAQQMHVDGTARKLGVTTGQRVRARSTTRRDINNVDGMETSVGSIKRTTRPPISVRG